MMRDFLVLFFAGHLRVKGEDLRVEVFPPQFNLGHNKNKTT